MDGNRIHFESKRFHPGDRPVRFRGSYEPTGELFTPNTDSLATFLVERYRYYTEAPSGDLRDAAIDHEPWPLYEADVTIDENSLFQANGFVDPASEPVYLYSPGVDTIASPNRRV